MNYIHTNKRKVYKNVLRGALIPQFKNNVLDVTIYIQFLQHTSEATVVLSTIPTFEDLYYYLNLSHLSIA